MTDEQLDAILNAVDRGEGWPWMKKRSDFTDEEIDQIGRAIDERIRHHEAKARAAMLKLIEYRQRKVQ